jgi:hypothetical protein
MLHKQAPGAHGQVGGEGEELARVEGQVRATECAQIAAIPACYLVIVVAVLAHQMFYFHQASLTTCIPASTCSASLSLAAIETAPTKLLPYCRLEQSCCELGLCQGAWTRTHTVHAHTDC